MHSNFGRCTFTSSQTQKHIIMNKQQLKIEIEKLAKEENISFIAACQAMQGAAAMLKNEKMIMAIHHIKMSSLKF